MFDPLNPKTWHEDREDFIVPLHEMESVLAEAEVDAEEAAQARAFYADPAYEDGVQREALRQLRVEQGQVGMAHVHKAMHNLRDAIKNGTWRVPEDDELVLSLMNYVEHLQRLVDLLDELDRLERGGKNV